MAPKSIRSPSVTIRIAKGEEVGLSLDELACSRWDGSAEQRGLNRSEKSSEYERSKVDDKVDRVTVVQRIT